MQHRLSNAAAAFWTAILAVATGCAPTLPDPFVRARAAAERAYANGRYDEAARMWRRASATAPSARERDEAQYRIGVSLARAGRHAEAIAQFSEVARTPRSERAPRAAYDRADQEIERGNEQRGFELMDAVVRRYPSSGAARSALRRYLIRLVERRGHGAARAYLDGLIADLDHSEIAELLHFSYASELEASGMEEEALARYLYVARRFPYPFGDYWDDSLYEASLIEERLGRPRKAVLRLRTMLDQREPSHIQGSYERPRYSQAQYRMAMLYRDALDDPVRARIEFRKLWREHPTSLLRDDARWNEARLARRAGDSRGACRALASLVREMPASRYVPCVPLLCPTMKVGRSDGCRRYIARKLGSGGQ